MIILKKCQTPTVLSRSRQGDRKRVSLQDSLLLQIRRPYKPALKKLAQGEASHCCEIPLLRAFFCHKNLIGANLKVSACPASWILLTSFCGTPPAIDSVFRQASNFRNSWRQHINTYVHDRRDYFTVTFSNHEASLFTLRKQASS